MNYTFCNKDLSENRSLLFSKNKSIAISDTQILELQDLFLCNGIHAMHVSQVDEGRCIIYNFLEALRCFNLIGCFTPDENLQDHVFNIYTHFKKNKLFDDQNRNRLEQFLLEDFDFDFIWIEQCDQESKSFLKKIQELKIDSRLPIILLLNN